MKNTLIIVGNGLSVDLCRKIFSTLNPSTPLSWNFIINQPPNGIKWQDAFPRLSSYAKENLLKIKNDFELFKTIRETQPAEYRTEARHFLALAYTHFDNEIFIPRIWKWNKFIKNNLDKIFQVISFNYDTVVERTIIDNLRYHNQKVKGFLLNSYGEDDRYLSVFKPHGCRMMEMHPNAIHTDFEITYPIKILLQENNVPLYILPRTQQLQPRKESFCILPFEENIFQEYQWQNDIWKTMINKYQNIEHCVIIGHSYAEVDRPEIDTIINSLPINAKIHICNPYPPLELELNLKKIGKNYAIYKDTLPLI
ncbi:hypothetical protein JAB6_40430 [Janthinobacterium sp. HH104]|uniref:hypothetical protein n=1 Tax=Janthinobacterium sp. HH104 TaxID=1537276 RepID=UPI000892B965|nr:hypothetical protein [Janthinobacterium sp. HH104]OEZ81008.1 hypothetical protein JAB6_40430 [Janthinobacterium sp. HH104]